MNLDEREAIAMAALNADESDMVTGTIPRAYHAHAAANGPKTVLADIARIKELEAEVEFAHAETQQWRDNVDSVGLMAAGMHAEAHGGAVVGPTIGPVEDVAALYRRAEKAEALVVELEQHILDIDAHATPYGDIPEEPGWIGTYLVTAGALHRALGKIGHSAPSCQAEAQLQAHRAFVAAFKEWHEASTSLTQHGQQFAWNRMVDSLKALDPDVHDETPEVRAIHNTP